MNAVEIVFTGLVYLLGSDGAPPVKVIIPNVSDAAAPFGAVVPPHFAYVKVRTKDVVNFDSGTVLRPPDFIYRKENAADDLNPEFAVFGLNGDGIILENQAADSLTICRDADCGQKLDKKTKKTTYARIPHRRTVCPECSALDPAYENSKDPQLVAARMILDHGRLSAANVDPGSEWVFQPLRHKHDGVVYHQQPLADQVVLDVSPPSGYLKLTIRPFDSGDATVVSLQLKDEAQVEIGNLMYDDVVPFLAHHGQEAVDPHFAHFYSMLARPLDKHMDSLTDPRIPVRVKFPPHVIGGPRQNCVPMADEP